MTVKIREGRFAAIQGGRCNTPEHLHGAQETFLRPGDYAGAVRIHTRQLFVSIAPVAWDLALLSKTSLLRIGIHVAVSFIL